jgi:hypothetical protein
MEAKRLVPFSSTLSNYNQLLPHSTQCCQMRRTLHVDFIYSILNFKLRMDYNGQAKIICGLEWFKDHEFATSMLKIKESVLYLGENIKTLHVRSEDTT